MAIRIFVEGIADSKFLRDYISEKYDVSLGKEDIIEAKGWTNLLSNKNDGELIKNKMTQNSDDEGFNILIFDADDDFNKRFEEIEEWKTKNGLSFEFFLFPNNSEPGDLETILENIINVNNAPIFECWEGYEKCLST